KKEVAERRFREDLYFRLNVISIDVPPLRRRTEDIPLLAAHFLARFAERNRKTVRGFSPQAMNSLLHYAWPGNVRELENAVERAVILCTGDLVTGKELPLAVAEAEAPEAASGQQPTQGGQSLAGLPLDEVERMAIEDTLKLTRDNKSEAARSLGITRATLHNKMRKYEIGKDGGRHD
ncbi:MAG: sigma-54-dependent Fis family transcriptional regulator, partial [Desulfovibrio sp.]|nr:sigma-54-dependent Fis family transcriptional regulator [Desulfovibrio sp.]